MPCVSHFYGISIYLYYNDHAPPHFHAVYGDDEALFALASLKVFAGSVPRRVRALVVEWGSLHHEELVADWDLARGALPLCPIPPLD